MAKLKSYFKWLIVLLSACLFCLIALFVVFVSTNQPIGDKLEEIEYLSVCFEDDIYETSKIEEIDSILIEGGAIKTELSKEALIDTGLLDLENNINGLSTIDYLNALLNYIGAFGWKLIEINDGVLYFYRSV